jgi:hypothetical protein
MNMKLASRRSRNARSIVMRCGCEEHRWRVFGSPDLDAGARLTASTKFRAAYGLCGYFAMTFVAIFVAANLPALAADAGGSPSAVERMQEPGPEAQDLSGRTGTWDVVTTFRLTPGATPTISRGVVAERKMVGLYLEEVMKPAPGSDTKDFRRVSYLTYSKVEGRWQYVSIDTRLPVGIMPATTFGKGTDGKLTFQFEPLGFVGFGPQVEGQMVRSNLVLTHDSDGHDVSQQYWITADGTGREWLAVQYEYTRATKQ